MPSQLEPSFIHGWSVYTETYVRDGKWSERGRACTPHPHQPGITFPSWWNVRQKAAVATLCVLCGLNPEVHIPGPYLLHMCGYWSKHGSKPHRSILLLWILNIAGTDLKVLNTNTHIQRERQKTQSNSYYNNNCIEKERQSKHNFFTWRGTRPSEIRSRRQRWSSSASRPSPALLLSSPSQAKYIHLNQKSFKIHLHY